MPKPTPIPGHDSQHGEVAQKRRGVNGASVETVAPEKRRVFSASEKLRIVRAADSAVARGERGALVALLRKEGIYKEGIYSSHLVAWRRQLDTHGTVGLEARKPGRTGGNRAQSEATGGNQAQ